MVEINGQKVYLFFEEGMIDKGTAEFGTDGEYQLARKRISIKDFAGHFSKTLQ